MDSSINSYNLNSLQFLIMVLHILVIFQPTVNTIIIDNHKLIFNQCSNQTSPNPSYSLLLPSLFEQFIAQSKQLKFFKTIATDYNNTSISGTFQCRNNLTPHECKSCVNKLGDVSKQFCGETIPARIQLLGCYAHYQEDGPDTEITNPGLDQVVVYKACSKHKGKKNRFEEVKYAALSELATGVINGEGFFEMTYESIYVVAQCVGNLGTCDCGECVNYAVEIVEDECRYSVSGEIYLESCFIRYNGDHVIGGDSFEDNRNGGSSPKFVVVVIGGLAALFVGFGLCYCLKSYGKKKDDW